MCARVMSKEEMEIVLSTTNHGMLGLVDGDKPYCIPFPFCYVNDAIYMGFFPKGRKWKIIQTNNNACFSLWQWGSDGRGYYSVVVEGKIEAVSDFEEIKLYTEAYAKKRGRDAKWVEERLAARRKLMSDPSVKNTVFKLVISDWGSRASSNRPTLK